MSGGSTTRTVTEPWEEQKPYLVEGFKQAGGLYNRGAPGYYPGQMTAQPSGTEQLADVSARNYLTGPRVGAQQAAAEKAMIGGLGGQVDYSQYQPMANVYGQQYMSEIAKGMPAVRQQMVEYGQHGGSSRGDIAQAQIVGAAGKNLAQNLAGLYGGAYSAAQERVPQFAGMYSGIMGAPLDMYGALGQIGQRQTARSQAAIDADMARYQYEAAAPQTQLANYMKTISGDYGGTKTEVAPNQFMSSLMSGLGTGLSGMFFPKV
jgi:hypothetical protein